MSTAVKITNSELSEIHINSKVEVFTKTWKYVSGTHRDITVEDVHSEVVSREVVSVRSLPHKFPEGE